jgi:hypothetical protein
LTENNINCVILYDNEEVGSVSFQGAESNLLPSFVERIASLDDYQKIGYHQLLANSFLISADAGHAVSHPITRGASGLAGRGTSGCMCEGGRLPSPSEGSKEMKMKKITKG